MPSHKALWLSMSVAAATPLSYASDSASSATADTTTLNLGTVEVSAQQQHSAAVLTSTDRLDADIIATQTNLNSWEMLGMMPGVQITEFRQGAVSGKPSIRGFNGEGEVNAVKLLIDGLPSNTSDGNMYYMSTVFPLETEQVEVVRGTNDARYGLHNIGGNVSMNTLQGGNYLKSRTSAGSFNTAETQLAAGVDNGNFAQNYFAGVQHTDTARDHGDSDKYTLSGKWFYSTDDDDLSLGLTARHFYMDADASGYLTGEESADDPWQSLDRNRYDGDEQVMDQFGLHLDAQLNDELTLAVKGYHNRYGYNRYVNFLTGQQLRDTDERHSGVLADISWLPASGALADLGVRIDGGVNYEHQDNQSRRYATEAQEKTSQTRNQQSYLNNAGAYVQAMIEPVDGLQLIPAYRLDRFTGSFHNKLSHNNLNDSSAALNDYGTIKQPKMSVIWAFADSASLYGNWGKTFQIGIGSSAYQTDSNTEVTEPSINTGWETGVKFQPASWLNGRVAVWQQIAESESKRVLNSANNDSEDVGRTRRRGLDVQLNLMPTEQWSGWLSWSWQRAQIIDAPDGNANDNNDIDHVPHYLISAGSQYQINNDWSWMLDGRAQGGYYINSANSTHKYGSYVLLNTSVNYQIDYRMSLNLQVRNLTDRYYEYVWFWSDEVGGMHTAGERRGVYLAFNYDI